MKKDILFLAWQPGGWELLIVALAALLLFGHRLPEVLRSLGKGISEFKKGMQEAEEELHSPPADVEKKDEGNGSSKHPPEDKGDLAG